MLEKKNLDYEKVVLVGVITATQNEEKAVEEGEIEKWDVGHWSFVSV